LIRSGIGRAFEDPAHLRHGDYFQEQPFDGIQRAGVGSGDKACLRCRQRLQSHAWRASHAMAIPSAPLNQLPGPASRIQKREYAAA
jgi:hypothetical protein